MSATPTHDAAVERQFSPRASAYLTSAVHAQGEDLLQMAAIARKHPGARLLDLGTGDGHVSFHVAPHVAEVVAYDLSQSMLDVVAGEAARRGLANLRTCRGKAEALPFGDGEFDLVMSRYSTHHWEDPGQALREACRVLKPGGIAVFADVVSPGEALLDTWLQTIEVLRDTSHVRDYSAAEWLRMAAEAGLVTQGMTAPAAAGIHLVGRAHAHAARAGDGAARHDGHRARAGAPALRHPARRFVHQRHVDAGGGASGLVMASARAWAWPRGDRHTA